MPTVEQTVTKLAAGEVTLDEAKVTIARLVLWSGTNKNPWRTAANMYSGDDTVDENSFMHVQFAKDLGTISEEQYVAITEAL